MHDIQTILPTDPDLDLPGALRLYAMRRFLDPKPFTCPCKYDIRDHYVRHDLIQGYICRLCGNVITDRDLNQIVSEVDQTLEKMAMAQLEVDLIMIDEAIIKS